MSEFAIERLPNGLRLLTIPMPHLHSAEMICYVGVGSRHEGAETSGISHFLEHMLFRGTEDYPQSYVLEAAFESIGGAVNASTDAETTCYHTRFHPERLELCAQLFASMLQRPLLQELEVERRIIIEEALDDYNEQGEEINPDSLTSRLLWPGHPLSQPTIGSRESLLAIDHDALRSHHRTYYTPQNTVIAVAGAVDHEAVIRAVADAFSSWTGQAPPAVQPWQDPEQGRGEAETVWVHDSDSQVAVQLAFRLPGRDDPRQIDLRVLRRLLAGGGTSRLLLRLREELGLTYSVDAALALFAESGCLSIDLAIAPESLVTSIAEVLHVLGEVRNIAVQDTELERLKSCYLYDLEFSRDHTDEMATRYGWGELCGNLRTMDEDRLAVLSLSAASLQRTAQTFFTAERLKVAIVGPYRAEDRKAVDRLLRAFSDETATKSKPETLKQ